MLRRCRCRQQAAQQWPAAERELEPAALRAVDLLTRRVIEGPQAARGSRVLKLHFWFSTQPEA